MLDSYRDFLTATLVNMGPDVLSKASRLFTFAVIRWKCRSQVSLSEILVHPGPSPHTHSNFSIKRTSRTGPSRLPWGTSDVTWGRLLDNNFQILYLGDL